MEGLYLYCIREKTESAPSFATKGIDGRGKVFIFPYRELEAVISEVSLDEFRSEEVQKKAQEDPLWIREKAVIHENVIEEAMRKEDKISSLIPMRFGIIFKDEKSLEEELSKDYPKIKSVLENLKGKQEWSIKIYLKDKETFEKLIKEKNETIKEKEKEIASLPEGLAFFMEEELKEIIAKEINKELNNFAEDIFERLKDFSFDLAKGKLLEKELTGKEKPMVLNVSCLILEDRIEDFKKGVEALDQGINTKGFYLEHSGPWPVYNFSVY